MLRSLPKSYDNLITALEARPENELSSEFIRNKLIDEYNRRKDSSDSRQDNNSRAYKTYTKHNNYRRENKYCTNCKQKTHNTHECWHLKDKSTNNSKKYHNQNRGTSNYNNTKSKHNSSMCFEVDRYNESRNKQEQCNARIDVDKQNKDESKHLSFLVNQSNKNKFIVDSVSSSHISNDKNLFTEFDNEELTQVMVANGNTLTSYSS